MHSETQLVLNYGYSNMMQISECLVHAADGEKHNTTSVHISL